MNTVVMCIGNREGGDDAIGPYIADQLQPHQTADLVVIDCGTVPENYTGVVKEYKPELLIIIDAVDMGMSPGDIRIVPPDRIGIMHISTHGIPLSVLITYFKEYIPTIVLLGIQPQTMSGAMSSIVKRSANQIVDVLQTDLTHGIKRIPSL